MGASERQLNLWFWNSRHTFELNVFVCELAENGRWFKLMDRGKWNSGKLERCPESFLGSQGTGESLREGRCQRS